MKLDYLLQFYWSKGFFYLNKHFICKSPIQDYLSSLPYFSFYHRNFFLLRLEAPMSSFFLKINNLLITPTLFIYLNFLLITFFPIFSNPVWMINWILCNPSNARCWTLINIKTSFIANTFFFRLISL